MGMLCFFQKHKTVKGPKMADICGKQKMRIALVGCSKSKKAGCHPAKDLYTSPRFVSAQKHARRHFDKMFILSAKHGLLYPTRRIKNYDVTLHAMSANERKRWSARVARQITKVVPLGAEIHFFCGKKYHEFLSLLLLEHKCFFPLKGLKLGQQLRWYKNNP